MNWETPRILYATTHKPKYGGTYADISKHTLRFFINQAMRNAEIGVISADRWGNIWNMSGHEARGKCFWCGTPVRNKRFCNSECSTNWNNHFVWAFASAWCLQRASWKCQKCGVSPQAQPHRKHTNYRIITRYSQRVYDRICRRHETEYQRLMKEYNDSKLEAHHIDPLLGEYRSVSKKNRPENLICLCHKCHAEANKTNEKIAEKRHETAKANMAVRRERILEANARWKERYDKQLTFF